MLFHTEAQCAGTAVWTCRYRAGYLMSVHYLLDVHFCCCTPTMGSLTYRKENSSSLLTFVCGFVAQDLLGNLAVSLVWMAWAFWNDFHLKHNGKVDILVTLTDFCVGLVWNSSGSSSQHCTGQLQCQLMASGVCACLHKNHWCLQILCSSLVPRRCFVYWLCQYLMKQRLFEALLAHLATSITCPVLCLGLHNSEKMWIEILDSLTFIFLKFNIHNIQSFFEFRTKYLTPCCDIIWRQYQFLNKCRTNTLKYHTFGTFLKFLFIYLFILWLIVQP